ncbi:hypothetical protein COCON_G00019660 [Conger conger]|uniref:MAM domain-containing protein n=1 Tax=Conger conger TaxID=82655 RepID=A0A9Q1E485_CONCO|nr:hypothetical protein COCON_G00019660 [Conger conger]
MDGMVMAVEITQSNHPSFGTEKRWIGCLAVRASGYTAGCTFDEDSSLCEYSQGEEDDFDWQLIHTYNSPMPAPTCCVKRDEGWWKMMEVMIPVFKSRASLLVTGAALGPPAAPAAILALTFPNDSCHFSRYDSTVAALGPPAAPAAILALTFPNDSGHACCHSGSNFSQR